MRINVTKFPLSVAIMTCLAVFTVGCGRQTADTSVSQVSDASQAGHDHSGWWCAEHGIPEEVCSMCSKKAANDFKAKGDWCEEHNRAESQCFLCDPKRAEKFAKLYQAKFGHAPPNPVE